MDPSIVVRYTNGFLMMLYAHSLAVYLIVTHQFMKIYKLVFRRVVKSIKLLYVFIGTFNITRSISLFTEFTDIRIVLLLLRKRFSKLLVFVQLRVLIHITPLPHLRLWDTDTPDLAFWHSRSAITTYKLCVVLSIAVVPEDCTIVTFLYIIQINVSW